MKTTPDTLFHIEDAQKYVGKEIAVTDWITLTQDQVTQFATSTKDPDWMHVHN
jgi:acyl dehydratase